MGLHALIEPACLTTCPPAYPYLPACLPDLPPRLPPRLPACAQPMGIEVDESLNGAAVGGKRGDVATPASAIRVLVIPTDEELSIAQQTMRVVNGG